MGVDARAGVVIMLNGASSAGKTTLACALQNVLPSPFLHFSFDHLRDGGILPMRRFESGEFLWAEHRDRVFSAYHRTLRAMVESGCNVLADHIIESESWRAQLASALGDHDVFLVAVRCPEAELVRREVIRGNRRPGEALRDNATCYDFCAHDFAVDSTHSPMANAGAILAAWKGRDVNKLSRFQPELSGLYPDNLPD